MTEFFGALFYPSARNASPPGKIEPQKNLSQNAPLSMCVKVNKGVFFVIEIFSIEEMWFLI